MGLTGVCYKRFYKMRKHQTLCNHWILHIIELFDHGDSDSICQLSIIFAESLSNHRYQGYVSFIVEENGKYFGILSENI